MSAQPKRVTRKYWTPPTVVDLPDSLLGTKRHHDPDPEVVQILRGGISDFRRRLAQKDQKGAG